MKVKEVKERTKAIHAALENFNKELAEARDAGMYIEISILETEEIGRFPRTNVQLDVLSVHVGCVEE